MTWGRKTGGRKPRLKDQRGRVGWHLCWKAARYRFQAEEPPRDESVGRLFPAPVDKPGYAKCEYARCGLVKIIGSDTDGSKAAEFTVWTRSYTHPLGHHRKRSISPSRKPL